MVRERKPEWIKARWPGGERYMEVKRLLREQNSRSVGARCAVRFATSVTKTSTFNRLRRATSDSERELLLSSDWYLLMKEA